jgi:AcrR family transcriptional regulator
MADRPYHHGNLRTALLAEAERTLREQGIGQLTLRDLARQAGVSHAAPRRHFADRQALLDALAEAGFLRLGDELRAAIESAGDDYETQLRAAATAYIRFATQDCSAHSTA